MDSKHDNAMRGKAFGRLDLLRTESKPPSLIFAKSDCPLAMRQRVSESYRWESEER